MKTNLSSYPDFQNAIQNNELVYLFGTGISSSLTGQKYSWWKWITDGTYHNWMKQSFEKNPITNLELARTLKKLLITQDVFATTNYDLLLEQATGLRTLSYQEPDVAFAMLKQHISSHVMHIHGVYDSARKIDNIVADQAQYDAVILN